MARRDRIPILYLAPWVDFGGSDKGTIDWFRWMDRDRFALSLITTQPSPNRRLAEVVPYAEEIWVLPDLLEGADFPGFVFDFMETREVEFLHIMNSRLGYLLLPDLGHLSRPPAVVVQLHVEEADRSGYVRYVTTRYGNLVDAFSVTSRHLADAVVGYGIPSSRCHTIYTGVDAEREFSPRHQAAVPGLDAGRLHVLFPARLTAQKDPLLMVRVVDALRRRQGEVAVHVLGDGELRGEVEREIDARGLRGHVFLHGPTRNLAAWYAACDVVLLTSAFEGVPYTLFEAMAMGTPTVAPALPGVQELMPPGYGHPVRSREDPLAYADALAALLEDPDERAAQGEAARELVRARYSLRGMADAHARLYDDLLARRSPRSPRPAPPPAPAAEPLRLRSRPSSGSPLVSVVIPCFNHGALLHSCLEAVRHQTYGEIETIVVDDGSTDPETVATLEELESRPELTVLRLPENRGPSAARNAGTARARGRYVLPVDADNLLVPTAVADLVNHLQGSAEDVGYVYPNVQYFGTRTDEAQPPDFNLDVLLRSNFADTCSLVDREVYEAGVHYAEDIRLGHEDWDFALQLADRGVRGEPTPYPTLLYRKWGFNRSDRVEHSRESFSALVERRHARLYYPEVRRRIKACWSPALSLIALDPVEPDTEAAVRLRRRANEQSCTDFELIVTSRGAWERGDLAPGARRVPRGLAASRSAMLEEALAVARGRFALVTDGSGSHLLANRGVVEQVLRTFAVCVNLGTIAFADPGEDRAVPFRLLDEPVDLIPRAVAWHVASPHRGEVLPATFTVREGDEVGSLLRALATSSDDTQWRAAPGIDRSRKARAVRRDKRIVARRPAPRASAQQDERLRVAIPAAIPTHHGAVARWSGGWTPPESTLLYRHVEVATGRRFITRDQWYRSHCVLEATLGSARRHGAPGAVMLAVAPGPQYLTGDDAEAAVKRGDAELLGYLEEAPLQLLDPVHVGRHRGTGESVLLSGDDDPLAGEVEVVASLGFVEPFPIRPRGVPRQDRRLGLLGLVRGLDRARRRHVYGVGDLPPGEPVWELGALHADPVDGSAPVWRTDEGAIVTEATRDGDRDTRVAPRVAARYALAPLTFQGGAPVVARSRAVLRRSLAAVSHAGRARPGLGPTRGEPVGYLFTELRPRRVPLFAARHPVTGDQLLTRFAAEAVDFGYVDVEWLGFLSEYAPVTGSLESRPHTVPWAAEFGTRTRQG